MLQIAYHALDHGMHAALALRALTVIGRSTVGYLLGMSVCHPATIIICVPLSQPNDHITLIRVVQEALNHSGFVEEGWLGALEVGFNAGFELPWKSSAASG
jgi:hypothetical protein